MEWRLKEGLSHPPEVPSIDVACTQVARDEEEFKRKLAQIRSLFEITLRVKIDGELKRAKEEQEKRRPKITKILCTSCKIEYTREQFQQSRFCRKCNNRISFMQNRSMKPYVKIRQSVADSRAIKKALEISYLFSEKTEEFTP